MLQCERAENPLGIDTLKPRLSWQVQSSGYNQRQTAYQVVVSSTPAFLAKHHGDLWDSGKIVSGETLNILYQGRVLGSAAEVFWKVRVWDAKGKRSPWSQPASWTMGLLSEIDWRARWITAPDTNLPSVLFRKEFIIKPHLRRALAFVCGLGQYELFVNGEKSGIDLLQPGWTDYRDTCLYDTHDVTVLLRPGANAVGMMLANGMYHVPGGRYVKFKGSFGPLKAIGCIRLEYADGSVEWVGTGSDWATNPGPLTFTCVYGGEDYDARKAIDGWSCPGQPHGEWVAATETLGPGGTLRGASVSAPPLRVIEHLQPVSSRALTNGVEILDLGQNAPLMPLIRARGPAGSVIRITPAELINPDGTLDRRSVGGGQSYWQYTCSGEDLETWAPQFFYHGCRYLQVERIPAQPGGELPRLEELVGRVVHSSATPIGEFACSSDLFNRTRTLIRWAQRANLVSLISDCPHRERLGWLEQYHLNGPSLRYEFDLARLFEKGMVDMKDSQLGNGMVPSIAPEYVVFGKNQQDDTNPFRNSPEWGSAIILVPWQQYEFTADPGLLKRYYREMKLYLAYLESKAVDHILNFGLGDWYDIGPKPPGVSQLTPRELTATAMYYQDTVILAKTAKLLGLESEASQLSRRAHDIRRAFNQRFFNRDSGSYATGSQCANAIPLVMNLCEPEHRQRVLDSLVKDVENRGNAVTAGDVGYRYVLRALADGGRSDVIFRMNSQSDRPGYGFQLKMGATSLTEAWDAGRTSSQNHFMLGHIMEWFYSSLAGISFSVEPEQETSFGFKHVLIRPQPVGDIHWVSADFHSVRGKIHVDWKRSASGFDLNVEVPANTTATVYLPAGPPEKVQVNRRALRGSREAQLQSSHPGAAVIRIGSGRYHFMAGTN